MKTDPYPSLKGKILGERAGVEHIDTSPVYILGHGSSGTSILAQLIREHLGVAFGTESQFIIRYYRKLSKYGDLANPKNRDALVAHLLQERWFQRCKKFGFETTIEAITQRIQDPNYAGILNAIFFDFADQIGMTRWGDKSPEYNHNLNVLGELFPDARFIHLIRDGRDVCLSLKKRYWGPKNAYTAAVEWKHEIEKIDAFLDGVPDARKIEVKYENLCESPFDVFQALCEFLNVPNCDAAFLSRLMGNLDNAVMSANYDKWKSSLGASEVDTFESVANETLRKHGYQSRISSSRKLGRLEAGFWRIHNFIMKYRFREYWQDNWYKAKIRSRDILRSLFN